MSIFAPLPQQKVPCAVGFLRRSRLCQSLEPPSPVGFEEIWDTKYKVLHWTTDWAPKKSFLKTRKRVLTTWKWNSWIANTQKSWYQPSDPSKAALLGEGPKDLTSGVIPISNESGWLIWLIYHQAKRHDLRIRGTTFLDPFVVTSSRSETTDIGRFLRDEILHALQGLSLYLCK